MTEEEKNREVAEIDARIQDLNAHRSMWARAGGMGGAMAMKAVGELEELQNKTYIPVMFYKEFYTLFKDRDDFKICVDYYISIMIKMIEDAIENKSINDSEYNNHLELLKKYDLVKLLQIFEEASDKTLLNAERKLLFDSIAQQIISYI